jgi:hypothetical protein
MTFIKKLRVYKSAVVGHERKVAVYFNRSRYLALVFGAGAGNSARENFAGFAAKAFYNLTLLEIDMLDMLGAKPADLPAGGEMPPVVGRPSVGRGSV